MSGQDNCTCRQIDSGHWTEWQSKLDWLTADRLTTDSFKQNGLAADRLTQDRLAADRLTQDRLAADRLTQDR